MQRPCLLSATSRVEFVNRMESTVMALPDERVLSDNTSEYFENTRWGFVGHQVFATEFPAAAVDQVYKLVSGKACADVEPPHPPQEFRDFAYLVASHSAAELLFRDFANLVAPHFADELSKWPKVSLWNQSIATMLTYSLVTWFPNSFPRQACLPFKSIRLESLALGHQCLPAFQACPPFEFFRPLKALPPLPPNIRQQSLNQLGRAHVSQPD